MRLILGLYSEDDDCYFGTAKFQWQVPQSFQTILRLWRDSWLARAIVWLLSG
jgi:hypothetical protein